MPVQAFIFDLDGTLIDANPQHVRAWKRTLDRFGYTDVSEERIAIEIGKGGDKLVPTLLGEDVPEAESKEMREMHDEFFRNLVRAEGVALFPQAVALCEALRARGLRTALATASEMENLDLIGERLGLKWEDVLDEIVTNTDVSRSKPEPEVVEAAVEKLGLPKEACVMIGDTTYDAEAAGRAGVRFIGLLTGFWTAADLKRAGAAATYRHTGDLLERLDEALGL